MGYKISHETIYAIIRKDKYENRGGLYKHCRHHLKHRHRPVGKRVIIPDRVSIHRRPPEADGKRFGDFEMDTIVGNNNQGAILTIVERSTNMLFMKKLKHGLMVNKKGCPEIFVPSDYHWGMGGDNQFYISTNQINIQGTNYHCGITLRMDAYFKNPGVLTYTHEKVFLWIGDDGKVVLEPHKNRWWLP